ncbi:Gfo/Idh/MocA family protein [Sinomonas susongensis]|uniref:Gfo/Idh/MocA family protein n=1 Tax=Sinomonas susongensis TaxID=1324851 RepID=UPI001485CE57|nr:Gfo/Idh/MocA family oxidoreductase [Sinomonas susongensis]
MKMHRVGIVGVWHVHAEDYVTELLERPDVEIHGVWDRDEAAAAAFAQSHGLRTVPEFEEMLQDPSVDAVVVTTATADHVDVITRALEAGKHVFSEKVLAIDLADAQALQQTARRARRLLFVSFQRLAEPWVRTLHEVVASGVLGRIVSTRFRFQHAGAVDGWLHDGFFSPSEAGGGALIDLGVHGFYLSQLFHSAFPSRVTCRTAHHTGRGVEDDAVVLLEYPDDSVSVLETSLSAAPDDARWASIHGSKGSAVVSSEDLTVRVRLNDAPHWVAQPSLDPWQRPIAAFLDSIDEGRDGEDNLAQSVRVVALVSAAYRAAEAAAAIQVSDPVRPIAPFSVRAASCRKREQCSRVGQC